MNDDLSSLDILFPGTNASDIRALVAANENASYNGGTLRLMLTDDLLRSVSADVNSTTGVVEPSWMVYFRPGAVAQGNFDDLAHRIESCDPAFRPARKRVQDHVLETYQWTFGSARSKIGTTTELATFELGGSTLWSASLAICVFNEDTACAPAIRAWASCFQGHGLLGVGGGDP